MGGGGWWVVVYLDYNVSSGPSLSFEIEIGDGPGPKLDNFCLFSHADASLLITHPAYDMWVRGGDTC